MPACSGPSPDVLPAPGYRAQQRAFGSCDADAVSRQGLFFQQFGPGLLHHRKLELMVAAWAFDRRVPKTTQVQVFLNCAYFRATQGGEITGFPSAGRAFFGKQLQVLTNREYLSLLAMLEAPNRYHILRNAGANADRVHCIERQVQQACREDSFQGERPVLSMGPSCQWGPSPGSQKGH